jgi:hypothetical protein
MKGGAQYGNRRLDLGLGSLPWDEHCKAIRARWIFRYLDATRSEFKYVLDAWFARTGLGRAAVFSTVPIESLTKSTTYRQPALPPFWKRALCDFRELKIVRLHPRIFETAEEALALPLWDNPLFPIKQRRFIHSWREALGIWRIRDTINKSRNTILDCDDMIELLTDRFRRAGANSVYASAGKAIPLNTLIRQWDSITSNIPSHIALVARRITTPKYLVYGIGARMLRMAGWREGESLGTRGGVVEPVETPPANKFNRGFGFLAADVHSTSLSHSGDFKATRWEGEVIYGTFDAVTSIFTKYALSVRGAPTTPLASYMVPPAHVTGVVWWGDGICGPAPITFPYPQGGWSLARTVRLTK